MNLSFQEVPIRGVRIRCGTAGEGPPLLLVHGYLVSHLEWGPMLPLLTRHFRCIVPDLPGAGGSDKPSPETYPYTREAFSETLRDLLRELNVPRAHVFGHSMGGAVSLTLAADHPEMVERLVVMDSVVYPFPLSLKGKLPFLPGIGGIVFKKLYGRRLFRDYFATDVFNGKDVMNLERVDAYYDDFASREGREAAFATLHRSIGDLTSLAPKVPRVKAPSLVLWGADDQIVPLSIAHRLVRELPEARLEVLGGVGHAGNEESPEQTASHVLRHFGSAAETAEASPQ